MGDNKQERESNQETMQGNLREKPKHASSFSDNQYAGEREPSSDDMEGTAGGPGVSTQGGGSDSSKQGGNTGHTPDASG